jgi:hypothetical protein
MVANLGILVGIGRGTQVFNVGVVAITQQLYVTAARNRMLPRAFNSITLKLPCISRTQDAGRSLVKLRYVGAEPAVIIRQLHSTGPFLISASGTFIQRAKKSARHKPGYRNRSLLRYSSARQPRWSISSFVCYCSASLTA